MNKKMILASIMALSSLTGFSQGTDDGIGIRISNLDKSVKAGNDFYHYACGGWIKANPITPEYSRYGSFDILSENNNKQLHSLIEGLAQSTHPQGTVEQQIGDLYRLAMDSVRRNKDGVEPVKADLAIIEAIKEKSEIIPLMARFSRMEVSGYFDVDIEADLKDSKNNLVQISQGGISLGQKDYYVDDDSATVAVRQAFRSYIIKLMGEVYPDYSQSDLTQIADDVLAIETAIAKASLSATEQRDIEANYHKMTFEQLCKDYPGINWTSYFNTIGFPAFNEVTVNQPAPIHEVEKVINDFSLEAQKHYMAFHLVNNAAGSLDDQTEQLAFDFYGKVLSGKQVMRPRWKRAVTDVEDVLGEAVGKMYAAKYFPASSKEKMLTLVHNLQKALGQRIDAQEWMSAETKQRAHEKLDAFYIKIGYPDKWRDYSKLTIDPSKSYYENLKQASEFELAYVLNKKVNKPVDRDEWHMTPQTVNAYYNPTTNEICFPAGILQYPFFDPSADEAFNYGAIGVVIGHEMTHGFDDQGRKFDKDGNMKDWWTEKDAANFQKRAKVLADFFNNITVLPGLKANGNLTLGENLADHGGLMVAYQALKNATANNPLPTKDGLTAAQRFYLAYAGVWANTIREAEIRKRVKMDPHSLGLWRVNGTLPHIDTWYDAFNIKKGDKLFITKEKRAEIW